MARSPDAKSYRDPGEVIVLVLREGFASGRVEAPRVIDVRARVPDLRVEAGDCVVVYDVKSPRERVGNRHYKITSVLKVDIRSASRDRAKELLDAVVEALDVAAVNPDRRGEYDELLVGDDETVASYDGASGRGGFTHIVLDVQLVKHLRQRATARIFGEGA